MPENNEPYTVEWDMKGLASHVHERLDTIADLVLKADRLGERNPFYQKVAEKRDQAAKYLTEIESGTCEMSYREYISHALILLYPVGVNALSAHLGRDHYITEMYAGLVAEVEAEFHKIEMESDRQDIAVGNFDLGELNDMVAVDQS